MKTTAVSAITALFATVVACGQGFINLDFEEAVLQPWPPDDNLLEWSAAVPGWTSGAPFLYYGQGHLGVSPLYLLMDSTSPVWAPGTQLAGNYSLYFASGYAGNDPSGQWTEAFILQSGLVPSSARSIRLLATGPFKVFLGGVEIRMFALGGNSYAGDVSQFAGETAYLHIINGADIGHLGEGCVVDNIEFSPEVVPEPSTLTLLGLGGFALAFQMLRRRGHTCCRKRSGNS